MSDGDTGLGDCSARVYGAYFSHRCRNRAKVTRDGKPYCGNHDPERPPTKAQLEAEERRQARLRRYQREDRLREVIANVEANAVLALDPRQDGLTDVYLVPTDDIDELRALLAQDTAPEDKPRRDPPRRRAGQLPDGTVGST